LEYSDDFNKEEEEDEEEPLLLLKNPRDDLSKPKLERSSMNYISSDEEDSLLFPIKVKTNQIQSLAQCDNTNTNTNVFQENIIDLMVRLYGQEKTNNK